MKQVIEHSIAEGPDGELAIIMDVLSFDEVKEPVLLVSEFENTAYLRRAPGEVYEIIDINAEIIDKVREQTDMVVIESVGDKIVHTYDVVVAPFEQIGDSDENEGGDESEDEGAGDDETAAPTSTKASDI